MFNSGNYEVQIRELTEKCVGYETEREEYREEIEKMDLISQKLYDELEDMKKRYAEVDLSLKEKYRLEQSINEEMRQEVEKWKNRFAGLETSKNREIEEIRLMMETQRKSMIHRELRDAESRFDVERNMLQNENRMIRDSLDNSNTELNRLRDEISRLDMAVLELNQAQGKL